MSGPSRARTCNQANMGVLPIGPHSTQVHYLIMSFSDPRLTSGPNISNVVRHLPELERNFRFGQLPPPKQIFDHAIYNVNAQVE
jgi:hypothetical protein